VRGSASSFQREALNQLPFRLSKTLSRYYADQTDSQNHTNITTHSITVNIHASFITYHSSLFILHSSFITRPALPAATHAHLLREQPVRSAPHET
jgi:hypothetical protein